MQFLQTIIDFGNNLLWSYVLIVMLIGLGLYFSIRTKFVQFKMIKEMFRLLGVGVEHTVDRDKKTVSSFQAFAMSTASRVGTGNLAGVALAITAGGPGAVFWMWVIALIGSASAFVESTLAQIYKVKDEDSYRGGPAYYMEQGLNKRWMGVIFSILISITFGLVFNSVQSNTISLALNSAFGFDRTIIGVVLAVLTGIIIFGGVQRIAKVSGVIVPVMAILYLLLAIFIIIKNITLVPSVLELIVSSAFGLNQAIGGTLGAALMYGIKRGLFSNEAGMGSAPNAAATAEVSHPVKQGLIQSLSVFTDTIVINTATAFIILTSGAYVLENVDGITLTQEALSVHVGGWAPLFVAVAIFLFAFSSVIGNYYYGETNIEFIRDNKTFLNIYRLLVVGMVMFGAVAKIGIVWDMADLFMGLMALINLIAITLLGKVAYAALDDYIKQKQTGKNPVFYKNSIPGLENVEHWNEPQAGKK